MGRALKHTVLVVEDDQLQRELVSLIFEESDMHVIQCMSAEAAAVVLENAGRDLTLMFTDVDLDGDMSGIELARIATQRFPNIDVIVTSGQDVGEIPDNVHAEALAAAGTAARGGAVVQAACDALSTSGRI